ncbi:MAG TPA: tyrosine--tRNA ligase [Candidatus Eisenbacteria bacterium]|jgi:tyrosyl-tRNA synthetase
MSPDQEFQILSRGAEEILPEGALLDRLHACRRERRPLRVKQGFDPTAPDIHLGHTVGLRKLRQFQDLGHQVVLIVGDYTGRVGDPSGRSRTRPQLTQNELEANARTYLAQFFRVLERDPEPPRLPVEIHRNGEWFERMSFAEVLALVSQYTVSQLLERDDFAKRFESGQPIGVHELLYPLMQGYDSIAIQADVELGATEQKYNLLVGRELQRIHGQPQQVVLLLPVLPGTDGVQRMSKSLGNYIGVADPPGEMFGKLMSIPDALMMTFWKLVTDATDHELVQIEGRLNAAGVNPMEIKKLLGHRLVRLYHGEEAADRAQADFEIQFSRRGIPAVLDEFHRERLLEVPRHNDSPTIVDAVVAAGFAASKSAARRLTEQGAVSIDGERVTDHARAVDPDADWVLRVGRKMARYRPGPTRAKRPEPRHG